MTKHRNVNHELNLNDNSYFYLIVLFHIFSYIFSFVIYIMFSLNIYLFYSHLIVITFSLFISYLCRNNYYHRARLLYISCYLMVYLMVVSGLKVTDLNYLVIQVCILLMSLITVIYSFNIIKEIDFTILKSADSDTSQLATKFIRNNLFFNHKVWWFVGIIFFLAPVLYLINVIIAKAALGLMFLFCLLLTTSFMCFFLVFINYQQSHSPVKKDHVL